jgi:D-alanyl-lipoteichoic acid acyltransferase DltB (MBOAT superfamily)
MPDRYTIKNTLLSVIIMGITSAATLVILSVFTYLFKWQAPQAQLGITLTYIISGFLGGFLLSVIDKNRKTEKEVGNTEHIMKNTLITGITQGAIYMAILLSISILISANESWDIGQIVLIWILLVCSNTLGIFLGTAIRRKG